MAIRNFVIIISLILPFIQSYATYKLNKFFYFDPVTDKVCNETNYWTPFDQSTTCYMFVSVTPNDNDKLSTIKLMLAHNIATASYADYKTVLKESTASWKRYTGKIDIIDEDKIYSIMKYTEKPKKDKSVAPPYKIGYYCSNSYYIVNGKKTNEEGYWTKTSFDDDNAYAIDINGKNFINSKKRN